MSAARDEVRARAARFADEELAPHASAWDRANAMPRSVVTRLNEL